MSNRHCSVNLSEQAKYLETDVQVWSFVTVHFICRSSMTLFAKSIVRTQMLPDAIKRQRSQAAVFCDKGLYWISVYDIQMIMIITSCYSNDSNSPLCCRARIIQSYLPGGAHVPPHNTWFLGQASVRVD